MPSWCAASGSAGSRVAVIGAGGIGVDVSEYLTTEPTRRPSTSTPGRRSGASVTPPRPGEGSRRGTRWPARATSCCCSARRRPSAGASARPPGGSIGRRCKAKGVEHVTGVAAYERIDDDGLHVRLGTDAVGSGATFAVDTRRPLCGPGARCEPWPTSSSALGVTTHVVGGADVAAEIDAKRAIRQATELAATDLEARLSPTVRGRCRPGAAPAGSRPARREAPA